MKYLLLLLVLCCAVADADGQRLFERKRPDIIPLDGSAKRIGWFVEPGITYTLPRFKNSEEEVFRSADTSYTAIYDPNGRLGVYIGAGATWFTRDPVIVDYFDLGLAYKNLRGSESYESTLVRGDSTATFTGDGTFAERFVTLNANANKFIQTGDYQFVQLSLGANADYRIGSSYDHTGDPALNQHEFPPDLIAQLHFKVGYGFKLRSKLLLIPAIETPIFSVVPEDQGIGKLQWFSSTYRPLILTVRFLFLRARNGFDCPPPIKHKGEIKTYKQDGYHPK
ncbi:MAG: hypothetical protein IPI81_17400 [Flavobacteriales bacterium]|nr:hypothetical protein [Flavobacteriales bacterium]MCC6938460.1 hypothetical protein [Flavobacteriales bacterium]